MKAGEEIPAGSTVLVTGATGFTGAVVVRKLAECGVNIRAIARPSSDIASLSEVPITWYRGQVYDKKIVEEAAEGVEYIFHIAAAFRQAGIPDTEYAQVHITSTQLLAEAALRNPNFKRFVHVSTMGVHGHIDNPPGDENSPFSPGDLYQSTKAEAELWLHEFARQNKLPYTVIRPCGIYGPGDKRLLKVFKMASRPLFPVLGSGKCLYHLIHVDDLADAIIASATRPGAEGQAFLCGNDDAIPLAEMAGIISKTLGNKSRVIRIPVAPFFVLADLCEAVCKPLGIEPPIYRRRVAFFTKDRSFNTSKLRKTLEFQPKLSNSEGITSTAKWYAEKGWL